MRGSRHYLNDFPPLFAQNADKVFIFYWVHAQRVTLQGASLDNIMLSFVEKYMTNPDNLCIDTIKSCYYRMQRIRIQSKRVNNKAGCCYTMFDLLYSATLRMAVTGWVMGVQDACIGFENESIEKIIASFLKDSGIDRTEDNIKRFTDIYNRSIDVDTICKTIVF